MIKAEVCANSLHSAIEGQKGGAYRIELCDNLEVGGITSTRETIAKTRQAIDIQLNILIRPREGDFLYSDNEMETMKQDIRFCGESGCNGVVFGILNQGGSIDKRRNKELLGIAKEYGMNATFHRAIDVAKDIFEAMEDVIDLGFDRILTSGGKATAIEGKDTIRKMIEQADNRIIIMPGSGITPDNIHELAKGTGLKEFHGSFRNKEDYTDHRLVKMAIENANK